MNTAFLNASVHEIHKKFIDSVLSALKQMNITAPVYMLKADGGTISINESENIPAQTITSGPAASIMGILGLVRENECIIALDIGGTTTDIAIIYKRAPLLEPEGITLGKYKTLIRALFTKSIGAGGDSKIRYDNDFKIGPERAGQPYCMNGNEITPTDAVKYLGLSDFGDDTLAKEILSKFSKQTKMDENKTAQGIVDAFVDKIVNTVNEMVADLNTRPVYTIHEIIEGTKIKPTRIAVIGGPASVYGPLIAEKLNCELSIPENVRVANAIGAAIARTTTEVTVHSDTSEAYVKCIEEDIEKKVSSDFTIEDAKEFARDSLIKRVKRMGADEKNIEVEITEAQSFNMVRGFWTAGKNIRVKAQVKPGIIKEFE
jgi:N-methylhydantoinase A/oxoprolinase/acetone carboxylase beta subunit